MTYRFNGQLQTAAGILALIGAVSIVLFGIMRPPFDHCDMPCKWVYKKGFDSCDPLKAAIDIKTSTEPSGHGVAVWYRATVTNQSCRILRFNSEFYEWNPTWKYNTLSSIVVLDQDGRPAPRPHSDGERIGISNPSATVEDRIDPYHYDPTAVASAIVREKSPVDGDSTLSFLRLLPGQSISASPSVLDPTREEIVEVKSAGYSGTALTHKKVPMAHPERRFSTPPSGYRRLQEFDLKKPGRYTAQFVVRDVVFMDVDERASQSIWTGLHNVVTGGDSTKYVDVSIKSSAVEFEIPR